MSSALVVKGHTKSMFTTLQMQSSLLANISDICVGLSNYIKMIPTS